MENAVRSNNSVKSAEAVLTKASAGAHAAVDSVAGAADGVARKAPPAIDHAATMAHQAVDRMTGAAMPTVEWLAATAEDLNATQKKMVNEARGYVSANPLKSVGIAAIAGFLISRLIRK
jgi:ElaB protein